MLYIGNSERTLTNQERKVGSEKSYVTQGEKALLFYLRLLPALREIQLRQLERALHGAGGEDLRAVVQVRVDVGRGADVAVTEPFLNLLSTVLDICQ